MHAFVPPIFDCFHPRGDGAYDRPPALVNVNVLNFNVLLTLAAVTVEGFGQRCEGPGELVRLVQALASSFEGLLSNHRTPVTLHGGVMDRDQLPDQHSLVRHRQLGSCRLTESAIG